MTIFNLEMLQQAPVTVGIILTGTLLSLFAFFIDSNLYERFILHPVALIKKGRYYNFLTSALFYGDMKHLGISMITLLFYGMALELIIGHFWFAVLFIASVLLTNIYFFFRYREDKRFFNLGASSAIVASIVCLFILNPFVRISIGLFSFSFPLVFLGLLYLGMLYLVISSRWDNVSHEATISGILLGLIFAVSLKPQLILRLL